MSVLYWFQDLPVIVALLLVGAYMVGLGLLLTWLGRRFTTALKVPENPPTAAAVQGAIGTLASILIGLVIVSLWNDYRAAKATVSAEATELRGAARETLFLPPNAQRVIVADLRAYVAAVANDEWPAMQTGRYSPVAGRALTKLTRDSFELTGDHGQMRAHTDRIAELRANRLAQTASGIVSVLWIVLFAIPTLLLVAFALMNDRHAVFHYTLVSLVAVATSLAIFVTLEIDFPYRGSTGLRPAQIARSVERGLADAAQPLPAFERQPGR